MKDRELTAHYVGTMCPDYLQDHHCRDGEYLLGAMVDGTSTIQDVVDGWIDSVFGCMGDNIPEDIPDDDIRAAILHIVRGPVSLKTVFDDTLPIYDDDDPSELPYAYAYLSWAI